MIEEVAGVDRDARPQVVPGASHFFVGRTDRLVEIAAGVRGRGGQPVVTGVATWRSRNAVRRSMADLPCGEVGVVGRAVAFLVRVLELVEGGVFRVEQLAVAPEEPFVEHLALRAITHANPLSCGCHVLSCGCSIGSVGVVHPVDTDRTPPGYCAAAASASATVKCRS